MYNQFKFLVFVNIKTKKVFRRSAFIQTNIFFLKIKKEFNKKDVSHLNDRVLDLSTNSRQFDNANCGKIQYLSDP